MRWQRRSVCEATIWSDLLTTQMNTILSLHVSCIFCIVRKEEQGVRSGYKSRIIMALCLTHFIVDILWLISTIVSICVSVLGNTKCWHCSPNQTFSYFLWMRVCELGTSPQYEGDIIQRRGTDHDVSIDKNTNTLTNPIMYEREMRNVLFHSPLSASPFAILRGETYVGIHTCVDNACDFDSPFPNPLWDKISGKEAEAQKVWTFRMATFNAQKLSGQSA